MYLETIFPALQNWNIFSPEIQIQGIYLQIILGFCKDSLLETSLELIIVCKIKWWTQLKVFNFHDLNIIPLQILQIPR